MKNRLMETHYWKLISLPLIFAEPWQQHLSNQISIIYWTQISVITTINYCIGWSSTIHYCRNCIDNYCASN